MEGLKLINTEMNRQHEDAVTTFAAASGVASQIATSVKRTGRLCLLGMGGSHWVNRSAMFAYRAMGIEVQAEVLSEALFRRLPKTHRTVLLNSQSGNSGEVPVYLQTTPELEERFGMTLNADSKLATTVPSMVAAGGAEKAFAATRSIYLSHAMHLAVLRALGANTAKAEQAMRIRFDHNVSSLIRQLSEARTVILSGRAELQGIAESGALCLMELARMPTYALEGGQLRHGPIEMLDKDCGIILLRNGQSEAELASSLAADCLNTGAKVCVLDLSRCPPIDGVMTLNLGAHDGMAAVFMALPVLQSLLVGIAARKVSDVGIPVRSSKVTTAL
jgi:fructoselysine-6-P-deglycase FrlB-like protein